MLWVALANASVLRHALIVGANEGGGSLAPLRYAESDAQRMAEVLVELGGFDPAYVTVLYAPTLGEFRGAIAEHAVYGSSFDEDLFLIYYSGHADAKGLRLGQEVYGFELLKSDVRSVPSEIKLGVIDACRSGMITRFKGAQVSAPFLGEQELAAEGEAWLTASSQDELAQESDQLRGSFFTHYLVSGLRGAAENNGDGEISLDEAYRYAFDRVVEHTGATTGGTQHPNFDFKLKGEGDLILTRVSVGRATVSLPAELEGNILVLRLPDRSPVAEVAKVAGRPVTLALAPGTYRFRLVSGKSVKETVIGLNDGSRVTVSSWGDVSAITASSKGELAHDASELARLGAVAGRDWLVEALNPADLKHSPLLGGLASAGLPGAGQYYNGQWFKGTVYMVGFSAFMGASLLGNPSEFGIAGSLTGPDMLRLSALMLYGAAIADGAYFANPGREWRPMRGWALSSAVDWTIGNPWFTPSVAGVNLDFPLVKGVSLGVDRLGWTHAPLQDEEGLFEDIYGIGSRADFYIDGKHFRPGFFTAVGLRLRVPDEGPADFSPVIGGGVNMRWYVTPRYFVQHEFRLESDGGPVDVQFGGGVGVHFGS